MVCSGGISEFLCVMIMYMSTWASTLVISFCATIRSTAGHCAALIAFPLLIYAYMYWHYFG